MTHYISNKLKVASTLKMKQILAILNKLNKLLHFELEDKKVKII
jgi:hypothetical protein